MIPEAAATPILVCLLVVLVASMFAIARRRRRKSVEVDLLAKVKIWMVETNRRPEDAIRAIEAWSGGKLPLPTDLHLAYIQALYWVGREADMDRVIEAFPSRDLDIPTRYDLARKLEAVGRTEAATEHYKQISKQDADYADVRMRLQRVTTKSSSDAEVALGLDPNSIPRHLASKYRGMELIGKGGMGFVFKAFDMRRKRVVALKALSPFLLDEGQALERFLREAKLLSQFEHPNVVKIFDVEEKPLPYYTMEFVTGQSLGHRLEQTGKLPVSEVLDLAQAVLSGLVHVHKCGVVHRDIKPENILLDGDGTPRLTDFGLAVNTQATRITQTGQVMGTLRYMPPEQLRGEETGPSGDLFSLGVTLYECLAGIQAFQGDNRMSRKLVGRLGEVLDREIPDALVSLVELMMENQPENRIASAAEALEMVRQLRRELTRKGPVAFLSETLVLRDRVVKSLLGFFSGLASLSEAERKEYLAESSNVRDLKMLIWSLNESIGRVGTAGRPPPGADPRAWARETGSLRDDLAKFVRSLATDAIDAFALRTRRLQKDLEVFLEPFALKLSTSVFSKLDRDLQGTVLLRLPAKEIQVFGAPDVAAVRDELTAALSALIMGGRPVLAEVEVTTTMEREGERFKLELKGAGIEREHVKAALLFEAMGAEVGFQQAGVFTVWLPLVMEDAASRKAGEAAAPGPTGGSGAGGGGAGPSSPGGEVVEELG